MTSEIEEFRISLLDMVQEQSKEPVPDLESLRDLVVGFTSRLEANKAGRTKLG